MDECPPFARVLSEAFSAGRSKRARCCCRSCKAAAAAATVAGAVQGSTDGRDSCAPIHPVLGPAMNPLPLGGNPTTADRA